MQEFFMDYGLWLLIGLLVIIGLVFLLSGKNKAQDATPSSIEQTPPAAIVEAPPIAPVIPVVPPAPVEPVAVVDIPAVPFTPVQPDPVPTDPVPTTPVPPAAGDGDDLLRLKGVGPKLNTLLISLGVTRFAQIAAWTDMDIATIDAKLGNFKGRPVRDQWVDQAKYLAAGDIAGFEAKYGKL